VRNELSILNEGSLNFNYVGVLSSVCCDKLSNHSEGTGAIDGHSLAVEISLARSVGVKVATILIADAIVAKIIVAALESRTTSVLSLNVARVQCV
jgi:hypothetical protein